MRLVASRIGEALGVHGQVGAGRRVAILELPADAGRSPGVALRTVLIARRAAGHGAVGVRGDLGYSQGDVGLAAEFAEGARGKSRALPRSIRARAWDLPRAPSANSAARPTSPWE